MGEYHRQWERILPPKTRWLREGTSIPYAARAPAREARSYRSPLLEAFVQEVETQLRLGILAPLETPIPVCNIVFPVPKPGGRVRVFISAKAANALARPPSVRPLSILAIAARIAPRSYMCRTDLSQAYFHLLIHPPSRRLFTFRFQERLLTFVVMPMGWSESAAYLEAPLGPLERALRRSGPDGAALHIRTDNTTTRPYVQRLGGRIEPLHQLVRPLAETLLRRRITVRATHLPGTENEPGDRLSRIPAGCNHFFLTPRTFQSLADRWGEPEVDLCAEPQQREDSSLHLPLPLPPGAGLRHLDSPVAPLAPRLPLPSTPDSSPVTSESPELPGHHHFDPPTMGIGSSGDRPPPGGDGDSLATY